MKKKMVACFTSFLLLIFAFYKNMVATLSLFLMIVLFEKIAENSFSALSFS